MSDKKKGNGPQTMDEGELNRRLYERRVKNFTLHIPDEEGEGGEETASSQIPSGGGETSLPRQPMVQEEPLQKESQTVEAISSFSDPTKPIPLESGTPTAAERAAAQKAREAHQQRNRMKRKKNRRFFRAIWAAMIVLVSVALGQYLVFGVNDMLASNRSQVNITVDIPEDPTVEEVASLLEEKGAIENPDFFTLYCKITNADAYFRNGTFELDTGMDYQALISTLQSNANRLDVVSVTFPEGLSVPEVAELLEKNGVCDADAILELCDSNTYDETYEMLGQLSDNEDRVYRLEGYLFPDTYDFYVDDNPVRVINKILANFDSKFTESMQADIDTLNESIRARMETEGSFSDEEIDNAMMDVRKILTVASLIEKEAGSDQERSLISSVIYNRLNTRVHELLQIDATVEYALGEHKTELTANDLAVDNPYNTYKNKGLPPGPIANPGLASIMAAIHPDNTDYYFYALNDSGTHNFFETYMDQQDFLNGVTSDTTDDETADDQNQTDGETANNDDNTDDEEPYYQETIVNEDGEEETVNAQ